MAATFCCSCCQHRCPLCNTCGLCYECCCCCCSLSPLPCLPPPPCIPPIPPLPSCPPRQCPVRVVHQQILVPYPFPVYVRMKSDCDYEQDICCPPPCPCPCPPPPCNYGAETIRSHSHGDCQALEYTCPRPTCKPFTCIQWPRAKRIHMAGCPVVPGYKGHIPGFKFHAAGRTFGRATKDTRCIMSQWDECCPRLPSRIWEQ